MERRVASEDRLYRLRSERLYRDHYMAEDHLSHFLTMAQALGWNPRGCLPPHAGEIPVRDQLFWPEHERQLAKHGAAAAAAWADMHRTWPYFPAVMQVIDADEALLIATVLFHGLELLKSGPLPAFRFDPHPHITRCVGGENQPYSEPLVGMQANRVAVRAFAEFLRDGGEIVILPPKLVAMLNGVQVPA